MKTLLLVTLFSASVASARVEVPGAATTVAATPATSCPPVPACPMPAPVAKKKVKKAKKKIAAKPALAPATRPCPVTVITVYAPPPVPKAAVRRPLKARPAVKHYPMPVVRHDEPVDMRLHLAVGIGVMNASEKLLGWSGLFGFRYHNHPSHLGAELYSAFDKGMGLQLMVWTVQGAKLSHHLEVGALALMVSPLSVADVPRGFDFTAGTGLEYHLSKKVDLTVDWRLSVADPFYMAAHNAPVMSGGSQVYGADGRYLDIKHVLGNSLTQSQLLLGVSFQ